MNKRGEMRGEIKRDKRGGKKLFIVLGSIFLVLIVLFFVTRFIFIIYLTNEGYEMFQEAHLGVIHPIDGLEEREVGNLQDAKEVIELNEQLALDNLNRLKTNGQIEVLANNYIDICEDGTRITPQDREFEKSCWNHGGSSDFIESDEQIYVIRNDTKQAMFWLNSQSSVIFLNEYVVNNLEGLEKDLNQMVGKSLDSLNMISYEVVIVAKIIPTIRKVYGNETNVVREGWDLREAIANFESFEKNLDAPVRQDIVDIGFKRKCVAALKNPDESVGSGLGPGPRNFVRGNILQRILFIRRIDKICEELEKSQKRNALKIYDSLREEENLFISANKKIYLNLFIKCNDDWFDHLLDSSNELNCARDYMEEIERDLIAELTK